jgi:hypothetical protein
MLPRDFTLTFNYNLINIKLTGLSYQNTKFQIRFELMNNADMKTATAVIAEILLVFRGVGTLLGFKGTVRKREQFHFTIRHI